MKVIPIHSKQKIKMQDLGPHYYKAESVGLGWSLGLQIFPRCPGNFHARCPYTELWETWVLISLAQCFHIEQRGIPGTQKNTITA